MSMIAYRIRPSVAGSLVLSWLFAMAATAQCDAVFAPETPFAVFSGYAHASAVWDPDGAGPAGPRLLVVGSVDRGADRAAVGVWDGTGWGVLGRPGGQGTAITLFNGQPTVALFGAAGPSTWTVASWDGVAWRQLGQFDGSVRALAVFQGALFAAGAFTSVGGIAARSIARFDGSTWSALGSGVTGSVAALTVFDNRLWVGGNLSALGPTPIAHLALWNGSIWTAPYPTDAPVECFAVRVGNTASSTYLHMGGAFSAIGAASIPRVGRLRLSTMTWEPLGGLLGAAGRRCQALFVRGTGLTSYELYAGTNGYPSPQVQRWTGSGWTAVGATPWPSPESFAWFGGQLVMAGAATTGSPAVHAFDGATWQPLRGPGLEGEVESVLPDGSGWVLGGSFVVDGSPIGMVARGSGSNWQPLGTGFFTGSVVRALCRLPNGDLVAGGSFRGIGSVAAENVARWNGSAWTALGSGLPGGSVHALLCRGNGELIAGGEFVFPTANGTVHNIARWDGAAWRPINGGLPTVGAPLVVTALAEWGDRLVAGTRDVRPLPAQPVTSVPYYINRDGTWVGTVRLGSWSTETLTTLADGDVVCGGAYVDPAMSPAQGFVTVVGSVVNTLLPPTSVVRTLLELPGGDLLAGGLFQGPSGSRDGLHRLGPRGAAARAPAHSISAEVMALAQRDDGVVAVAGAFLFAGAGLAASFVGLVPPCPASAAASGPSCSPLRLDAVVLPWLGGTCRTRITGLAPGGLAFDLLGVTPLAIPLSTLHPAGTPGCELLVDSIVTSLQPAAGGVADAAFALPHDAALVGLVLRQQAVQLLLGSVSSPPRIDSSNALDLQLGWF